MLERIKERGKRRKRRLVLMARDIAKRIITGGRFDMAREGEESKRLEQEERVKKTCLRDWKL